MTNVEKLSELLKQHKEYGLLKGRVCMILGIPEYVFDSHINEEGYAKTILKRMAEHDIGEPLEKYYVVRTDTTAELRESVLWLIKEKGWQFFDICALFGAQQKAVLKALYKDMYDVEYVNSLLAYINMYANGNFATKYPTQKQKEQTKTIVDFLEEVLNNGEEANICKENEICA